ncbi:hypothetical protein FRB99_006180, partial [Tulasnella sp. 403]
MNAPRRLSRVCTAALQTHGRRLSSRRLLHVSTALQQSPVPVDSQKESAAPPGLENGQPKEKSPHAEWYSGTLPAMIPIAVLAYAVYLVRTESASFFHSYYLSTELRLQGLGLARSHISHEKYKIEAEEKISELEKEVSEWREKKLAEEQKPPVED